MSLLTPEIVSVTLGALGGTCWEQRVRTAHGRVLGERCVVTVPHEDALLTMAFVVQAAGGTIEGNPAQLAGGMRLPEEGELLSFSFPAESDAAMMARCLVRPTATLVIDTTESDGA